MFSDMIIIETPIFTRIIQSLLTDESYRLLQLQLIEQPDSGDIIKGSGGVRKLRWPGSGRGKRGGVRIIYYWFASSDKLLMLYAYPKSDQEDLTSQQLKLLRAVIEEELS